MIECTIRHPIKAELTQIWNYVSNMANWASNMPGYRAFEIVNAQESLWTLKIGFGQLVRTVKVRVQIEIWREPDRVDFCYRLDDDPVSGCGHYAAQLRDDGEVEIELSIHIVGEGRSSPVWEAMGRPVLPKMVGAFAKSLKTVIEGIAAVEPQPALAIPRRDP